MLAMKGVKIYDLDADPVDVKRWTELENMRAYYEFFDLHKEKFMTDTGSPSHNQS